MTPPDRRRRGRCPGCGGPLLAIAGVVTRCRCGSLVVVCRSGRLRFRPRGVGDLVANLAAWFGITPASWSRRPRVCGGFLGVWMKPGDDERADCNCGRRRAALNAAFPLDRSTPGTDRRRSPG